MRLLLFWDLNTITQLLAAGPQQQLSLLLWNLLRSLSLLFANLLGYDAVLRLQLMILLFQGCSCLLDAAIDLLGLFVASLDFTLLLRLLDQNLI